MADQLITIRQSAGGSPARTSGPARRTSAASTVLRGLLVIIIAALVLVVIALVLYGWSYYSLPLQQRFRSPLHADLKPSGRIGHLLGSVGSVLLIGLLPYSVRKRFRVMSDWGPLSWWLKFHIFCGIAGPILITFHTSFKVRGIVAISYWSMIAVAASGIFGRYLYAQIPRALSGKELKFKSIHQELERMHSVLSKRLDPFRLRHVLEITDFSPTTPRFALLAVILMIRDDVGAYSRRRQLRRVLAGVPGLGKEGHVAIWKAARERELLLRRIALLNASRDLFKYWHIIHVPLAQTMYITMFLHIGVALMTGYF